MITSRQALLYLAVICNGDWDEIYKNIADPKKEWFPTDEEAERVIKTITSNYITCLDQYYPFCLKQTFKPPFVLFYYGDLSLLNDMQRNLSVVGSREYSAYGYESTVKLVSGVVPKYNIVSGLAKGIDRLAHEIAIKNGGKTIAVLGNGIDICYPSENVDIYNVIKKDHLVISEYPNSVMPSPSQFPIRNRIVVGLSKGILVTEAHRRSGSGISARLALEMNRYCMFVPYHIDEDSLCNDFIRDGAYLVQSSKDILDILD